jgi:lipopolysaccharide export system permease protein
MPTIIDRYMLRQFVQVLIICLLSLIGLYIVIDAFSHLDHFIEYAGKHGSLIKIMAQYYAYRSIAFFDRTSGVLTLIAVMFTVTWIQRHHEMTALLAAGITRTRVLRPVLLAAVFVSLFAAANREVIIPSIRDHLATDSKNIGGEQQALMQPRYDSETGILIQGERVIPAQMKIFKPSFLLSRQLDQFGKQLSGWEAVYMPAEGNRPSGYLISAVSAPKALLKSPPLLLNNKQVVLTPIASSWLRPDQVFVVSGVDFKFLAAGSSWNDFASTQEMVAQLRSPSVTLGADVRVAVHSRFMRPFLDTTLLFLGLPFVVTRTNRNPFIALGMCLAVVTVFMLVSLGCQQLGTGGWLTPSLSAWLPVMIFAPIAAAASDTLRQ